MRSALVLAAATLATVVAGSAAEAQERPGTLVIEGDHPGAEVYVDTELVGTLPLDPIELVPGNHTIRVTRPGYTEHTDVFRIRSRRETVVSIELFAVSMALSVTSVPEGAQVFVDGDFAGETPVELDLLEGEHSLRLRSLGYHEAVREVTAVAGQRDSLAVELEELPQEQREQILAPTQPDEWYEEPLTWIIAGSVAAAAIALTIVLVVVTSSDDQDFCPEVDALICLMPRF